MNYEIQRELTPELSEKIWRAIEKKLYDERVSKQAVLHHLKQLKAQMGKDKAKNGVNNYRYRDGVDACMTMIDKKIAKINLKNDSK